MYKQYGRQHNDSQDMINQLKSTNVALGFVKGSSGPVKAVVEGQTRGKSIGAEIGERTKMYTYVKDRGFASNVLPSKANQMKPTNAHVQQNYKSTNQATFKWNNFKVA